MHGRVFRTNHDDVNINETSSYVDLAPLYGNKQETQDKVRDKSQGRGLLHKDAFAEDRLLLLPPETCAILVCFSRNHNVRWTSRLLMLLRVLICLGSSSPKGSSRSTRGVPGNKTSTSWTRRRRPSRMRRSSRLQGLSTVAGLARVCSSFYCTATLPHVVHSRFRGLRPLHPRSSSSGKQLDARPLQRRFHLVSHHRKFSHRILGIAQGGPLALRARQGQRLLR